jgi:hypothetical protein
MLVAVVPYLVRMRTTLRPAAAAVVLVAALSATACTPPPEPPRTPAPSSTPLFASDEEALAAAEAAYAAYATVIDNVLQNGGRDTTPIRQVAEGAALRDAVADAGEFEANGYRTVGTTRIIAVRLQSNDTLAGPHDVAVRAYVCEDVSKVDLLDSSGKSLVSSERPNVTPFQAAFAPAKESSGLVVVEREIWGDSNVCE